MSWDTEILTQLKKYALGELHGDDRVKLEKMLSENAELREELEVTKALIPATEAVEKERLIHLIEKINAENIEEKIPAKNKNNIFRLNPGYNKWAWAAGIAAILAICFWLFFPLNDPLDNFSQTAYFTPSVAGASLKGTSQNKLSASYREYQKGNFMASNQLLNDIATDDSLYLYSLFLQGHNYYRSENFDAAISTFDQLISLVNPDTPPRQIPNLDNAGWTRILAIFSKYKKGKDPALKKELLNAINTFKERADEKDVYFEKAVLLEKLLAGK